MKPVLNNSGGLCAAFPDTCKTPSPGGPVPITYPNIAQDGDGNGAPRVKVENKNVLRKGDKLRMSSGDEAGTLGGIISSTFKRAAELMGGCSTVKAQGKDVSYLFIAVGQNGGQANAKTGKAAKPGQTKAKIESTGAKEEDYKDKAKPYKDDGEEIPPDKATQDAAAARGRARSQQGKINASEQLGEAGAINAAKQVADRFGGLKAITSFAGKGVFDVVAEFGNAVLLIEAKGGGSSRGFRKIGNNYYRQGTRRYRDAIINQMKRSKDPARRAMGRKLAKLAKSGKLKYYSARTRQKKGKAKPTKFQEFDPPPASPAGGEFRQENHESHGTQARC